ncbi:sensor histidine kinase [Actinomadura scrupuli]|uniref:sensor histidine kinase n=1 Tax=Actinomadura scrupuli TaxID=559629 RepID=UPI003D96908B
MTVVAGVIAALGCIAVSAVFVLAVRDKEADEARVRLTESSERVLSFIRRDELPALLPDGREEAVQVLDPRARVVAATQQLAGKPRMATFRPPGDRLRAAETLCPPAGLQGCMVVTAMKVHEPDGVWLIYAARPTIPWYGPGLLPLLLISASLLFIATMTFVTYHAVGRTLAPVDAIRTQLAEITATALGSRVPVPKNQDEIRMLAETVNDTLDRLEAAYAHLRQFTSDASHDLRSPITAVRTQVEEALMHPENTDWPQTGQAVVAGMERLQAIVTDLLALARLDAGVPLNRVTTDLAELVETEVDSRAYRVEVVKKLQRGVYTLCDRLRLARLLANLMDNAERHAATQIQVVVRAEGETAVLEVIDDGTGVAPELRDVIFERFSRLDAARSRDAGGTGLGLAIAREIAEAHEGTLTIEDSERGARFVLRIAQCDPFSGRSLR